MWAILIQAVRAAGVAALGYFANDIGDATVRYFPGSADKNTGKISWGWMIVVLLVVSALFAFIFWLVVPAKWMKEKK